MYSTNPDKYGQKFWLAVDVELKYVLNGFPYLGKVGYCPYDLCLSLCCNASYPTVPE
jgi:hypothetical protein